MFQSSAIVGRKKIKYFNKTLKDYSLTLFGGVFKLLWLCFYNL